jgi:hypothetical protein
MRIRIAVGVAALAIAPLATSCSINIGDCVDFAGASAKLIGYQAAIVSGELNDQELADAQAEVAAARNDVPDGVADEFNVAADAFDVFFAEIEVANEDGEITDAEWEAAAVAFETDEVNQAFEDMGTWVEDNCVPGT